MKTSAAQKVTIVAAAVVVVIAVLGYAAMASPVTAQSTANTTTTQSAWMRPGMQSSGKTAGFQGNQGDSVPMGGPMMNGQGGWGTMPGSHGFGQSQVNVTVGETITLTSTQGSYFMVGTPRSNGTASGTLTFTVTGKLSSGYTLSVTGGSVTVAGTTFTLASGTAQMNRAASSITGQGATSPSGEFILRATARGTFVGSTGLVSLDMQSGSTEYLVSLTGSITS